MLKNEGEAPGFKTWAFALVFKHLSRDLANVNAGKSYIETAKCPPVARVPHADAIRFFNNNYVLIYVYSPQYKMISCFNLLSP